MNRKTGKTLYEKIPAFQPIIAMKFLAHPTFLKIKSSHLLVRILPFALAAVLVDGCCTNKPNLSPPASEAQKMKSFEDMRFGMFIHWGLYSVPAGEWKGKTGYAEWFQLETKMPLAEYAKFADQFDPKQF